PLDALVCLAPQYDCFRQKTFVQILPVRWAKRCTGYVIYLNQPTSGRFDQAPVYVKTKEGVMHSNPEKHLPQVRVCAWQYLRKYVIHLRFVRNELNINPTAKLLPFLVPHRKPTTKRNKPSASSSTSLQTKSLQSTITIWSPVSSLSPPESLLVARDTLAEQSLLLLIELPLLFLFAMCTLVGQERLSTSKPRRRH
ncbi:unnamed protein product, partial [Ectocarpus sp. 12 AP-2014]